MNDKSAVRGLYLGWGIAAVALGVAVTGRHPHGFYVLLRWICFLVFGFAAFFSEMRQRAAWAWVFAIEAVLFNPLVQVHFRRETWQTIDWLAIGSIVAAVAVFSKYLRSSQTPP